jgi:hypothetical protein
VGIALAYAPLAQAAAEAISSDEPNGDPGGPEALSAALAALLPGPGRCPACRALAEAERDAIRELVGTLAAQPDHGQVPALCVRHLAAVVAANRGPAVAGRLAPRLAQTLRRAAEDLQTYSLKRESLRAHLLSDEEQAACMQALRLLAGRRELARPFRQSDEIG